MANAAAFMKISDLFFSLESFLKKTGQIYFIDQPVARKLNLNDPVFQRHSEKKINLSLFFTKARLR